MKKTMVVLAVMVFASLSLAACGGDDSGGGGGGGGGGAAETGKAGGGGGGGKKGGLIVKADPGGAFNWAPKQLQAKSGKVTITLDNPASLSHDIVIEENGKQIAKSDLVSDGDTKVTADLKPGKYTYFCNVPGHREGGMEGTLNVK
jgi:plastocyanin